MKVKRVCVFTTAYLPLIGGAEIALHEITKRIPEVEFDIYTALGKEDYGRVSVIQLGAKHFKNLNKVILSLLGARRVEKGVKIEGKKYDLIWAIMASYGGFAAYFYKKKHKDIPFLLTLQEGDSFAHILKRVRGFTWLYKKIFTSADKVQAISSYLANWAVEMGFMGEAKVISNGYDENIFNFYVVKEARKKFRIERLNIPEDAFVIISVSRFVEKNGLFNLLEAFSRLPQDAHLVLVGDGLLRKKIEKFIFTNGLKNRVRLSGTVPHEKIADYLHAADVFCRPSISEGFGNVFIEAMASGLPVVSTNVGGLSDFMRDGQNVLVVPPEHPDELANALNKLRLDAELREKLKKGGFETAMGSNTPGREGYTWDSIAKQMKNLMESMVSEK